MSTDSFSPDEDRAIVLPDERTFQGKARLQTWSWQYLGPRSKVYELDVRPGQCDGKLWDVVIKIGEVIGSRSGRSPPQ